MKGTPPARPANPSHPESPTTTMPPASGPRHATTPRPLGAGVGGGARDAAAGVLADRRLDRGGIERMRDLVGQLDGERA